MGLLFGKIGYYLVLGWCCVAIFVFMVSRGSGLVRVRAQVPRRHPRRGCQVWGSDQRHIAELKSPGVAAQPGGVRRASWKRGYPEPWKRRSHPGC